MTRRVFGARIVGTRHVVVLSDLMGELDMLRTDVARPCIGQFVDGVSGVETLTVITGSATGEQMLIYLIRQVDGRLSHFTAGECQVLRVGYELLIVHFQPTT
jgi:hypothetical protein